MLPLCKSAKDCGYERIKGPWGESISIHGRYSIQEQIEKYIETATKECVNLEGIEGFNRTFTAEYEKCQTRRQ